MDRNTLIESTKKSEIPLFVSCRELIRCLKDDFLQILSQQRNAINPEKDIRWVLTVPAIWTDAAKQFMRDAATEVGLNKI